MTVKTRRTTSHRRVAQVTQARKPSRFFVVRDVIGDKIDRFEEARLDSDGQNEILTLKQSRFF